MKRLLIPTLALTTILTACSIEEEPTAETNVDTELVSETTSENKEVETEEIDNSERYQFEVGTSKNEQENATQKEDERQQEAEDTLQSLIDDAEATLDDHFNARVDRIAEVIMAEPVYEYDMGDVHMIIHGVAASQYGVDTIIDVIYTVENNSDEMKNVPVSGATIVTDRGEQLERNLEYSDTPSYKVYSGAKPMGDVAFLIEDTEYTEIKSVDVYIPGVDFDRDLEESFTITFDH